MKKRKPIPGAEGLTLDEASVYLGVALSTLYKWVSPKVGKLTCYKIGMRVYLRKPDLDEFLQGKRRCSASEIDRMARIKEAELERERRQKARKPAAYNKPVATIK